MALGTVAVRSGPGTAYDRIGNLAFSEVRIIVGRTQYFPWWQIQYTGNQTGWVSAEAVDVQGYTADVPIVNPPLLDDNTPEAGPEWEPTADPTCIVTVNTASASPSPITVTQEPAETTGAEISPTWTTEAAEPPVASQSPTEVIAEGAEDQATGEISEQPNPEQESSTGNSSPNWILGAGLLLIVAAVAIYVIQRLSK
jgi:uncharacterized protein YraI